MGGAREGRAAEGVTLEVLLERWLAEGVIDREQAARMRETASALVVPGGGAARGPLVVEALGYLGGAVVLVAGLLVAGWFWNDLGTATRLLVLAATAGGLLAAGALAPDGQDRAGARMRTALWVLGVGAVAAFLSVLAGEAWGLEGADERLLVGVGAMAAAAVLHRLHRVLLLQAATAVAGMASAAALVGRLDGSLEAQAFGVWAVAAGWAALGWLRLVHHARQVVVAGAALMLASAAFAMSSAPGLLLALVTVALVVTAALATRDLVLLAVGALGTLVVLPAAVSTWFPGRLAAPFALLVVGGLLVVAAIAVARRGGSAHTGAGPAGTSARPDEDVPAAT